MTFETWWRENAYRFPQADYGASDFEEVAKAAWDSQQAKIDRLMLEYCPDEMTEQQKKEWARHQVSAGPEASAALDKALGINRG